MLEAYIDIAAEMLAEAAAVLQDGGISIVSSLCSEERGSVRLHIRGDALPEACRTGPLRPVTITFTVTSYGRQRLTRISDITLL